MSRAYYVVALNTPAGPRAATSVVVSMECLRSMGLDSLNGRMEGKEIKMVTN